MQPHLHLIVFACFCLAGACTTKDQLDANRDFQSPTLDPRDATTNHALDTSSISEELCNERDDDEDGLFDEGFNLGAPCQSSAGRCQAAGQLVCSGNGDVVCNAPIPEIAQERCNDRDDDCDGRIDEDFDVDLPCTNALGACAVIGRSQCNEDEQTVFCQAEPHPPLEERCNDLDDDCDGQIDEDFPLGEPCSIGLGHCAQDGVTTCDQSGTMSCNAQVILPNAERCNRVDDDCDGVIDEVGCTDAIIDHCLPTIIWRTDLDARPLPLQEPACSEEQHALDDFACSHPTSPGVFSTIALPFRLDAVILGYGFGLGLRCHENLPEWMRRIVARDCRLFFGYTSPPQPPRMQTPTLSSCPQEFFGYDEDFRAGCGSVPFDAGLGGLEFNRALDLGDQIGFGFHCRQTISDPENAIFRTRINEELQLQMLWTKAGTETEDALAYADFRCPIDPFEPTVNVRCATSNDPELFGLLSIDTPATPANPQTDVIGIRLRRNPEEVP